MSELLNRFSINSAQWNLQVAICLGLVWMAILFCAISSIRSQGFSAAHRRFWIAVVVAVPILGLLAYLPFSFRREDLPQHIFSRTTKDRVRRLPGRRSDNFSTPGEA